MDRESGGGGEGASGEAARREAEVGGKTKDVVENEGPVGAGFLSAISHLPHKQIAIFNAIVSQSFLILVCRRMMPRFASGSLPPLRLRESIFYEFGRILEETRRRRGGGGGGGGGPPLPSSDSDFHSDIPRVGNNAVPWLLYIESVAGQCCYPGTSRYPIDVTISS